MAVIATIEDTIVAALTTAFNGKVPVQTVPAEITSEEWTQRLRAGTAVYVAWIGASTDEMPGTARLVGDFAVYVVSESAGKEVIRRRGNDMRQGAYLMIEIAVPAVHNLPVKGIGTLQLVQVNNLFSEGFDKLGVAVYGIHFRTQLAFDQVAALNDFLRLNSQFDLGDTHQNAGPLPVPPQDLSGEDLITLPGAN